MESNTSDSGRGSSESDVQTGCTLTIPKSKELGRVQIARKLENVHVSPYPCRKKKINTPPPKKKQQRGNVIYDDNLHFFRFKKNKSSREN